VRLNTDRIITGTVMSEVLPVTTLMTLVRKKVRTRANNLLVGMSHPPTPEGSACPDELYDPKRPRSRKKSVC
jgi:hypothetical protein